MRGASCEASADPLVEVLDTRPVARVVVVGAGLDESLVGITDVGHRRQTSVDVLDQFDLVLNGERIYARQKCGIDHASTIPGTPDNGPRRANTSCRQQLDGISCGISAVLAPIGPSERAPDTAYMQQRPFQGYDVGQMS